MEGRFPLGMMIYGRAFVGSRVYPDLLCFHFLVEEESFCDVSCDLEVPSTMGPGLFNRLSCLTSVIRWLEISDKLSSSWRCFPRYCSVVPKYDRTRKGAAVFSR